jgi:hypothetical protein
MSQEEFDNLRPGMAVSWTVAGYSRTYQVLVAPRRTGKEITVKVKCLIYGDHEFSFKDIKTYQVK